jgi:hypothetical protein
MSWKICTKYLGRAAALATGCEVKITMTGATHDLRQNTVLGGEVANVTLGRYGEIDYEWGIKSASTDFVRFICSLL